MPISHAREVFCSRRAGVLRKWSHCADDDPVAPQEPTVTRLTLGRCKWAGYVATVLLIAAALGLAMSATGALSLVLGCLYFACVAWIALDLLYFDAFEIAVYQDTLRARSLLRSYSFDLESVASVKRSAWPMLFGLRIYKVRLVDPEAGHRRLKIISAADPRDFIGGDTGPVIRST